MIPNPYHNIFYPRIPNEVWQLIYKFAENDFLGRMRNLIEFRLDEQSNYYDSDDDGEFEEDYYFLYEQHEILLRNIKEFLKRRGRFEKVNCSLVLCTCIFSEHHLANKQCFHFGGRSYTLRMSEE